MAGAVPLNQYYQSYIDDLPLSQMRRYCKKCPEYQECRGDDILSRFEDCDILQEVF